MGSVSLGPQQVSSGGRRPGTGTGRRRTSAQLARAAVMLVLVCGAAMSCSGRRRRPPPELTVLLTSNTVGNLDKCRCRGRWTGGIARRATAIREKGAALAGPTIVLDAGGLISAPNDMGVKQLEHLLASYERMGYGAVNVGRQEAQLDLQVLQGLRRLTNVRLISANLLTAETGDPAFDPWVVLQLGEYRVGVIGILSDRDPELELGAGLGLCPPREALQRELLRLNVHCSFVIVLACAREEEMKKLVSEFPGIDLILGGEARRYPKDIARDEQGRVFLVGNLAKEMGLLHLGLDRLGTVLSVNSERVELSKAFDEDPEMLEIIKKYKESVSN